MRTNLLAMRRPVMAAAWPLLLGGCSTWAERPNLVPGPQGAVHGTLRVTRSDGFIAEVDEVQVRNDTLAGTFRTSRRHAAIALSDIRRVESRTLDPLATLGATLLAATAAMGVWLYALLVSSD